MALHISFISPFPFGIGTEASHSVHPQVLIAEQKKKKCQKMGAGFSARHDANVSVALTLCSASETQR